MQQSESYKLIHPYGGKLNPLLIEGEEAKEWQARNDLKQITLSSREAGDLFMLGIGGFSPLEGFMGHDDWKFVCSDMQTAAGIFWPIPITLAVDEQKAKELPIGDSFQLCDKEGKILGIILLEEKYPVRKSFEAVSVFGTEDQKHPGVANIYSHGDIYLAGKLKVFTKGQLAKKFPGVYLTPQETRAQFIAKGWRNITAFQTRNPMHRAHEFLVKIALETSDGVMIHSLLGNLKKGDIDASIRIKAIASLINNYFPKESVMNCGYPLDMRYAGPREALLHALFRQNYGCSHLIVGRDHAGVGNYYEPFASHNIFSQIPQDALQIKPMKLDWTFWCNKCEAMASTRTCPHDDRFRLNLSGTELRNLLTEGKEIPPHFSRPEVLEILQEYYRSL